MLLTVVGFTLFIFYGSYNMVLENSKLELKGAAGKLNEVFDNFRLSNRLKAVTIANQISLVPEEMRQKKILNNKGQIDRTRMYSMIMGKLELNFNPKTEYIVAYYDIQENVLLSIINDEILSVIIGSELFSKVKENNISCDIITHKNRIYIVALSPVFLSERVAGSVIIVKMIDDTLAYNIADIMGFDITILSQDNLIGSTFRQSMPEVLVSIMQAREPLLLHGSLKGGHKPYFPINIPAMITVYQDLVVGKDIKLAVTSRLEPKFRDLREIQFIALVVLIGVLMIGVIISFSISRTIYDVVNIIVTSLAPAIKGNLSVHIPEIKIPTPFDELVRSINKILFVAREKVASPSKSLGIFAPAAQQEDIRRTFTGEIKVASVRDKPVSGEVRPAEIRPPSADSSKISERSPEPVSPPRPVSGEIFVGQELNGEDVGPLLEEEQEEEYNPDAPMVASLDMIEALDKSRRSSPREDLDEFRKLFDKYIAMRLENGESVENLNFDNFMEKIKVTKAELQKKGSYRDVKFDVIIKNNKVTLKATH